MSEQVEKLIKRAMWVVIFFFVLRCLVSWDEVLHSISPYTIFGYAGEAIGITAVIVVVYNLWLWKYDPTIKTPVLHKKYTGTIKSSWNGETYSAKMEIKQTLLKINVILKTDESTSKSMLASIDDIYGEQQLTYTYLNTPTASVRDRSAVHYGTAMICVENPLELTGTYFTDRKSTGDLHFIPET